MRKFTLTLSAAALALTGGGVAFAAHHEGGHGKHGPDADGNGEISQAEHRAHADMMFAKLDSNSDGVIDETDRAAHKAARAEKKAAKFAEADTDGDGELSASEMEAMHAAHMAERAERKSGHHAKMLEKFDADGSGALSQEELKAAHEARKDYRSGKRHKRHSKHAKMHRMLKKADADGDNSVTRAEFDAAADARFAKLDADGSGSVSKEERQAAREAKKARMKEKKAERYESK